jgi:hypothetical protein
LLPIWKRKENCNFSVDLTPPNERLNLNIEPKELQTRLTSNSERSVYKISFHSFFLQLFFTVISYLVKILYVIFYKQKRVVVGKYLLGLKL